MYISVCTQVSKDTGARVLALPTETQHGRKDRVADLRNCNGASVFDTPTQLLIVAAIITSALQADCEQHNLVLPLHRHSKLPADMQHEY